MPKLENQEKDKFTKAVEKALEKPQRRYGFSIPSKSDDPSEIFLGEYINTTSKNNQNINISNLEKDVSSTTQNKFVDNAAFYPKSAEEDPRYSSTTKCEVLTLSKEEDLKRFNDLLSAKNSPKSKIKLLTLDKQYSSTLNTWQILAIYEVIDPINVIKP